MLENIRGHSRGSIPPLRMPSPLPHDLCHEWNVSRRLPAGEVPRPSPWCTGDTTGPVSYFLPLRSREKVVWSRASRVYCHLSAPSFSLAARRPWSQCWCRRCRGHAACVGGALGGTDSCGPMAEPLHCPPETHHVVSQLYARAR